MRATLLTLLVLGACASEPLRKGGGDGAGGGDTGGGADAGGGDTGGGADAGPRAQLTTVRPAMSQYPQPSPRGPVCVVDDARVEVGLLPLYTHPSVTDGLTVHELIVPGDALGGCVLHLEEGREDTGATCNLGADDVAFSDTRIQLLNTGDDQVCCGGCGFEGPGVRAVDCAAYGDAWSCNEDRDVCERSFELQALSVAFDPLGDVDAGRLVALVMDNSGTLNGNWDGVPDPSRATDRSTNGSQDFRIAAAMDFVGAMHPTADQVSIYTYDTAGGSGVNQRSETGVCEEIAVEGWVAPGEDCARRTILDLTRSVASGTGSPIWDAVVRAVDDLRQRRRTTPGSGAIVVFADGPPDSADASLADSIAAAQGDPADPGDDIPVFVVHLDNIDAMAPPTGRYADYDTLACTTGGAYFHVDDAGHLSSVYSNHLPFLLKGRYRLEVDHSGLKLGDSFPAGSCYAIQTQTSLTIDGEQRTMALQKTSAPTGEGAKFDSRIHVCKP